MIKRRVSNTGDPDYPKGERQYEYRHQFLFREPAKSPMFWEGEARGSLVLLLQATQQKGAWEFLLKKQLGKEWYIARVYDPNRLKHKHPIVVFDSQSLNVFIALVSFYCIGYKRGVIEFSSDWYADGADEEINERYK